MLAKSFIATEVLNPVAISDKQLAAVTSFTLQTFDLCTICGARFGIGYHGACGNNERDTLEMEEWSKRLTEILAKDHRQDRAHKPFIDLDF
jgi:hypothetical protein